MSTRAILILCAQALLTQSLFSQCTSCVVVDASGMGSPYGFPGSLTNPGFTASGLAFDGYAPQAYDGLGFPGCGNRGLGYDGFYAPAMEYTATGGGGFTVTSTSATSPTGISIVSDNVYEGVLSMAGELPFVGTTGMDGMLPTAGIGSINHSCGNGINAMSALSVASSPASVATMAGPGFGTSGFGCDGLIAPVLAAPAYAYDGIFAPGFPYDGLAYGDATCASRGLAFNGLGYGSPIEAIEITPTSGGALPVSSASAIPPTGIFVASDNVYEGALALAGETPFVGTVGVEGTLPSAGAGAINHACGNGRNAMISESAAYGPGAGYGAIGGISPAAGFASGFGTSAYGYRGGLAGRGCGCAF